MPPLRKHRRDRRARAPRPPRQRNLTKFIPGSDSDFEFTARNFASYLAEHAAECGVSADDVAQITEAVEAYQEALAKAQQKPKRSELTTLKKNKARRAAEAVVRRYAAIIKANPDVESGHKKMLRLKERPKTTKVQRCPQRAPVLSFLGSGDGVEQAASITSGGGGGSGIHVLEFWDCRIDISREGAKKTMRRAKPAGAVRLELFVDLVPPGDPVPKCPVDRVRAGRGWPWYLRSFTKSPIEVTFPIPAQPMLVCYWARWADSAGNVGPFSKTCVARVEGWTANAPQLPANAESVRVETPPLAQLPAAESLAEQIEAMEARYTIMQLPFAEAYIAGELPAGDQSEAA